MHVLAQGTTPANAPSADLGEDARADLHERFTSARRELARHVEKLHTVREPWSVSLYDLQAEMFGFPPEVQNPTVLSAAVVRQLDRTVYRKVTADIGEYWQILEIAGQLPPTAWQHAVVASDELGRLLNSHVQTLASHDLPRMIATLASLAQSVGLTPPIRLIDWRPIFELFVNLQQVCRTFRPELLTSGEDLAAIERSLRNSAKPGKVGSITRLSPEYRRAKTTASGYLILGKVVDDITLHHELAAASVAIDRWRQLVGTSPVRLISELAQLNMLYEDVVSRMELLDEAMPDLALTAQLNADAVETVAQLATDTRHLQIRPRRLEIEAQLASVELVPVVEFAIEHGLRAEQAADTIRFTWLRSIYSVLANEFAAIDASENDNRRHRFCDLDRALEADAARRIHAMATPDLAAMRQQHADQLRALESQSGLSWGHAAPHELVARCPDIALELKRCWAMSPLAVATLLPAERLFDTVIFDEANQIAFADAVPALLRASQVVVFGDAEQIAPATFRPTHTDDDAVELGEHEMHDSRGLRGVDSILDYAASTSSPRLPAVAPWRGR